MKKTILAVLLIGTFLTANAQFMLTNAILALQNGEVKVAKESIDKYMIKEKSLKDPKGWFYKGNIYESVYLSKDKAIKDLDTNALRVSVEAYNKTLEFDKPDGEWAKQAKGRLEGIWGESFNKGIDFYNKQQYLAALPYFQLGQEIKPNDTLAFTVGASVAIIGKDYEFAKKSYRKLLANNFKSYSTYKNLLYIYLEQDKNQDEALKLIQEARKEFPKDNVLMAQEVNLYIATGKQQEAISKLTEAIATDSANAKIYLYNLGIIYKQTKEDVKAKESFKKSLAIDSLYEGSNYMMGLITMEEGDVLNKKVNNMTLKEYNASGKKEEAKREATYKKSIPYLERAYAVSKEEKLKDQLISLYKRFKMEDKIKRIQ